MSGTSVDAVSVALVRIIGRTRRPTIKLIAHYEHPIPAVLKAQVRAAFSLSLPQIAELNTRLGELFAKAVLVALRKARLSTNDLDLIGSHGQTVYHHSRVPGALRTTLQLADGDIIAARTGVLTVCDFRQRDIAHGGEGAPLTPYTDWILYGTSKTQKRKTRIILNLGGVANITVLHQDPAKIIGFDTGPANGPIDRLARIMTNEKLDFDRDARLALKGRVLPKLFERLMREDSFHTKPPPKSTGPELYGDLFVQRVLKYAQAASPDVLRTLTEFSAELVAYGLRKFGAVKISDALEIVVAGGGAKNPLLLARIAEKLAPAKIISSESFGIPVQAREALAFALLAHHALHEIPAAYPSITGVTRPVTLGKLCLPC